MVLDIPRPGAFRFDTLPQELCRGTLRIQAFDPLSDPRPVEVTARRALVKGNAMKVFRGVDELRGAVGTHLGHSDWYEIDQRRVDLFAEATGDFQWIHVDRERAADGPFGGTIAHGFLTLSLLPVLTWEVSRTEGFQMEINYGLNKVRFPAPVPVPSRVRAGVELISVEEFGEGFMSTARIVIEREGGDKPVCVADSLGYMVPA